MIGHRCLGPSAYSWDLGRSVREPRTWLCGRPWLRLSEERYWGVLRGVQEGRLLQAASLLRSIGLTAQPLRALRSPAHATEHEDPPPDVGRLQPRHGTQITRRDATSRTVYTSLGANQMFLLPYECETCVLGHGASFWSLDEAHR